MDRKEYLRGMLEAIKELKAQYYVGSVNAYAYLRAVRWLDEVREGIVAVDSNVLKTHDLSDQMLDSLTGMTKKFLSVLLSLIPVEISTPECCTLLVFNDVSFDGSEFMPSEHRSVDYSGMVFSWTLPTRDLSDFLAKVLRTGFLNQFPQKFPRYLCAHLSQAFRSGALSVRSSTGERFFYSDYCEYIKRVGSNEPDYFVNGVFADLDADKDVPFMTDSQRIAFRRFVDDCDLVAAHPFLQEFYIQSFKEMEAGFVEGFLASSEIRGFSPEDALYDPCLYERAMHEYTLGHTDVERRILLNALRDVMSQGLACDGSIEERLDDFYEYYKNRVSKSFGLLQKALSMNAPSGIIWKQRDILQRVRYILVAILQNRPWLKAFLAR